MAKYKRLVPAKGPVKHVKMTTISVDELTRLREELEELNMENQRLVDQSAAVRVRSGNLSRRLGEHKDTIVKAVALNADLRVKLATAEARVAVLETAIRSYIESDPCDHKRYSCEEISCSIAILRTALGAAKDGA